MIRSTLKSFAYGTLTTICGDANGFVTLPVLSGPAKGLHFHLDLVRRKEAHFWGKYDRNVLTRLGQIIRNGWTIWDCGTHLGYYTVYFARAVGPAGKVVAIEPDARNLGRTRHNVILNGYGNVFCSNFAIGRPNSYVDLYLDDTTNSHIAGTYVGNGSYLNEAAQRNESRMRDAGRQVIKTESVGLDEAFFERKLPRPDLIKLDIEGAEKDALPYATRLAREIRPIIVLELHNRECDEAAWAFARDVSYSLESLNTGRMVARPEEARGTLLCRPA